MICLSMLQGIRVTLAPYKLITVGHLTVLYVKAVQKRLTIELVIVGGVTVLKSTGPIPNQGPVQPRGEVTFQVSADWFWAFFDRLEQARLILSSGQGVKARKNLSVTNRGKSSIRILILRIDLKFKNTTHFDYLLTKIIPKRFKKFSKQSIYDIFDL